MLRKDEGTGILVVSALDARSRFGRLLRRVEDQRGSLVMQKRGSPKAELLSIRDDIRLAAPEPRVPRVLGEASRRQGTDTLTSGQIDRIIKSARKPKPSRR